MLIKVKYAKKQSHKQFQTICSSNWTSWTDKIVEEALMEDLRIENTATVENEIESDSSAALLKECDQHFKIEGLKDLADVTFPRLCFEINIVGGISDKVSLL